jgi:hypothetical protein
MMCNELSKQAQQRATFSELIQSPERRENEQEKCAVVHCIFFVTYIIAEEMMGVLCSHNKYQRYNCTVDVLFEKKGEY